MRNVRLSGCLFQSGTLLFCTALAHGGEPLSIPIEKDLELAISAEARGDSLAAIAHFRRATARNPASAEAWAALGEHLRFYAHDPVAARSAFERALNAENSSKHASAFAWRGIGEIESKAQQTASAIECFKKSLAIEPLADTHRSLCHLFCVQHDYASAALHAHAAVELNPGDPIARLLYATQLHRAGRIADGRRQYQSAFEIAGAGPLHCCIYYNAAGYLSVAGDEPGALEMLSAFSNTPNHRHLSRQEIESDSDFAALAASTAFQRLLDEHLSPLE